jgi:flagellar biosynthesis protein FliR
VSFISRTNLVVGTIVFLFLDGHHVIILAAIGHLGEFGLGVFRINASLGPFLLQQVIQSFELAVNIAAPILATTLVTQFVLGLITKFIPQVNIFIISLPLTILIGFYIIIYTLPGIAEHLVHQFSQLEELTGQVLSSK